MYIIDYRSKHQEQIKEDSSMRIVNLKAENIKKLVAVEISPTDNTVIVTGKNGAGKSSVLDAIWWALSGTKHIQDKPIRDGQTKASIRLDLGTIIVERVFSEKGSSLKVMADNGAKFPEPQTMLDKLLGAITFDPLEFARMKAKDQYETLRQLVKLEVDIDDLEQQNKVDYDRRTEVNRRVKALEEQIKGLEASRMKDAPKERVDVVALSNEINGVRENYRAIQDATKKVEAADVSVLTGEQAVQEAEARLQQAKQNLARLTEAQQAAKRALADLPPVDTEAGKALQERLEKSQEINRHVDTAEAVEANLAEKRAALTQDTAESEGLTKAIEERTQRKTAAIAGAKMPIDGLSLDGGRVLFNGIPLDQASSAEQLRVSTAIAMASNPELRVIRIKDGSLLDPDGMAMLKAMANESDFQIWIERVADSDPIAVVIEDGSVVRSIQAEAA
jgi:DNA repair exonuclease SbcCD ATPase subunit